MVDSFQNELLKGCLQIKVNNVYMILKKQKQEQIFYMVLLLLLTFKFESKVFIFIYILKVKLMAEQRDPEEVPLRTIKTNHILVQNQDNTLIYYLPCYVRLKVKNVTKLDVESLSGSISATLLFGFHYGNLRESILKQFIGSEKDSKSIIIQLARQSCLELRQSSEVTLKISQENQIYDYVVRKEFQCNLDGDVFLTPFEIFNLNLQVTVQTIVLDPQINQGKNIHIKFNCMSSSTVSSIEANSDLNYGPYSLAHRFLQSDYSNQPNHRYRPISVAHPNRTIYQTIKQQDIKDVEDDNVGSKQVTGSVMHQSPGIGLKNRVKLKRVDSNNEKKLKCFQYAHFRIPLFKHPIAFLVEIFIPVWVLAAINLGIYFQDNVVIADKIASIATVILALVAFIPSINAKIPETDFIKLVEIILYLQVGTTMLTLLDALFVQDLGTSYVFNWRNNGYYLVTVIINITSMAIIFVLAILHKCWWERVYLQKKVLKTVKKFVHTEWENKECDDQFKGWQISYSLDFPIAELFSSIQKADRPSFQMLKDDQKGSSELKIVEIKP